MTSSSLLEMSYTELEKWWSNYLAEQKSWGAILERPYPELLTTWYAERLIDGSIPASEENILAAKRHMRDLERQGTDDFPWIFDEEKGHRPIRFIEKKCKPSKGDFDQLVLQPWQHFVIGSLFGWVHKDTGIRRFREALDMVGRKNGKTTLISGLSNYMLGFDNENGARIYVLANAEQQAHELFDEAKAMVEKSPYLSKRYKAQRNKIKYTEKFAEIQARASDSKRLDGLNTHLGIFDEIHEFKNFKLINVIKKSRGARKQPLIIYITTAGYVLDGPLMTYIEQAKDCLDNLEDNLDERTFYYVAKLDKPEEADHPELWIKANPNIGLMDFVNLVSDWKKDKRSPQERADWMTKQFNIFSDVDELSFVDIATIKKNNKVIDLETLKNRECIAGYDLSETEDFTAAALEFPLDDGSVFILCHSWIPQARYDRDSNPQRLDEWKQAGYLTVIPGDYVNYEYVFDWFVEQAEKYRIKMIAYDKAKALYLNKAIENHGFKTKEVRQGFLTLGGPMQNFKELLLDGKVIFNRNKMFQWYLNNVRLVKDRNDNWMPTKQNANRKIDGFAAALNAHTETVDLLIKPSGSGKIKAITMRDLLA
ncbi:phage terminase large subunit-like protein [Pullulanibacillus pueri]|uniref:Terminase n=1 Tax=Pullulanibacillus pueri TaxID=1437324 RepID=A0A8J2ZX40_9BACL|nr:terminase large subunit [Pullulanibacillus pueri]MBM7681956.1 phage terminase large subunit-like protein [Pullulanibacillus pueri]GGH83586.1 terminase [Pullulanibacillus pueri]